MLTALRNVMRPAGDLPDAGRRLGVRMYSHWHARWLAQEGQATAEYGLVVVAAAGIAAALIAFGKGGFQAFFGKIIDRVIDQIR